MICALLLAQAMTVSYLEGPATGQPRDGAPVALAQGAELQEGETVQTGPGARLEIKLATGTLVRIGENTKVTLRGQQRAFSAALAFGNFWAKVHKLLDGESFSVETENGVAGVRGTEFRVETSESKPVLLRVYEGVVQVDGKGFETRRIAPGIELRFGPGEGPRAFDPASEKGHAFMDWVRSRPMEDGLMPGEVHEQRNPEREDRRRERLEQIRERRRELRKDN